MKRSEGKSASRKTAAQQRSIQKAVDDKDRNKARRAPAKKKAATQAGPRRQPEPPLPKQHQRKPGSEAQLRPAPRFEAAAYRGSGKLDDKVALITGGDSGIGRAVAVLFAREGANVAIVHLDEDEDAAETRRRIEGEGRQCLVMRGDVRDPAFCIEAVERTIATFGKLDVLVNNAAFQAHADSLEQLSEEHLDMTLRTNVYGYFHMARAALPYLPRGGSIINTGSETGLLGSKHLLDYSATKGAIHAFTKSLASNLVDRGIRVNAVAPGPVWTPLNPADATAEHVAEFGSDSEMKRPAQPEEISPAYVFLAAPACSSYITGIVLPVMGGPA
jgi:NAD(P)-dependent dehydrogenase (short-subunit alcohol dehydrogenase family)